MSTPTGRGLPEKIGHYKIVSELGRGGMGVVYKAFEESLNRFVAIKVLGDHLASDEQFLSRFTREARAAGGLSHPNVIPIYFIGEDNGLHYFAMEYVSGRSVQSMIRSEGRIDNPRASQIILQAAQGLAAAHDNGIIHRDIKPANLMVDDRGVVKIADFGVALPAEVQTKLTATGALMGTPGYLSPEQCMGESIDQRTDIYALGVTYFEMLTGRMPFNAESPLALLRQILQDDPPDVSQLNAEVDDDAKRILKKMIARNRDERYQTCHELIPDLEEYLAARKVRSVTASLATRSNAAPGAAFTPTAIVGAETVAAAKTVVPATQVTAPGNAPFVQPVTQPAPIVPPAPPPVQKKKSSFALIAAVAILAFVATVAGAGMIGYKYVHGFFSTTKASVLPMTSTVAPAPVKSSGGTDTGVELSDAKPSPLDSTQPIPPSGGQAPSPVRTGEAPVLHGKPPVKIAQVAQNDPPPPPPAHHTGVAVVVQGESALNGAVSDVLNSEVSSAGLQAVNPDDLSPSASTAALLDRLRGKAGTLLVARIEPTGEREIHYMGRSDTAYSSRVTVTAYDVASGRPIGARGSGSIEYTSINAAKKAEEVVGPLAQKAVEAIQNH
jgi:eukaryotic-like serine/threonine-protein kinase